MLETGVSVDILTTDTPMLTYALGMCSGKSRAYRIHWHAEIFVYRNFCFHGNLLLNSLVIVFKHWQ